ncbi:DUF6653 family protein [Tropicimonas sp. S265A]|uniref:DUF6653 family protein n=1 Tax=Tropicimonas sp. S265A TaxID=3415134 RepID=UPI003C7C355B
MGLFRSAERLMGMTDASWARHANPWSGYSRFIVLPLLVMAIWARIWLGWYALVPVVLCLAWAWINPRAFPPPATTAAWATQGVLGERAFLNRKQVPIPKHHETWAYWLTALSAAGLPPLVWGLWVFDPSWTLLGLVLTMGGKIWFVDRMAWLWADMKAADPTYEAWERGAFT